MTTRVSDRPRVLVVEDEPIAREILSDLLKMAGYDVLATHNGEQALLTLVQERGRINCLFTAVELPGLVDGWILAEEFRVAGAALPVVFASKSTPARALGAESTAFVAHPVLPPQAVEAVKSVTGRSDAILRTRGLLPRVIAETDVPQAIEPQLEVEMTVDLLKAVG